MVMYGETGPKMPSVSNPLQQAVFRGCVECISVLVETPPYYSVDACCGPEGLRPIHIAAREGHISSLRYLASAGACVLKVDISGCSALHHAAIGGQVRAVRWLLRHGAKITLDKRGRSPIQAAADHDHMDIVGLLAKHAASVTTCLTLSSPPNHHQHHPSSKNSSTPSTTTTIAARNHHSHNNSSPTNPHHPTSKLIYGQSQGETTTEKKDHKGSVQVNNVHSIKSVGGGLLSSNSNCGSGSDSRNEDPKVSAESSSSGNSSLATSGSNSPSLSPSATCSCSSSSETSDKSAGSSAEDENYSSKQSSGSVTSFFLHPPKSSISSKSSNSEDARQQRSSSQPPFYLHLPLDPEDQIGSVTYSTTTESRAHSNPFHSQKSSPSVHFAESDVEIHALDESMAPVTPVSVTEFLSTPSQGTEDVAAQQTQEQKFLRANTNNSNNTSVDTAESSLDPSSPSPPPHSAKTVRIQSPVPGSERLQVSSSVRNAQVGGLKNSRPPPPPPPMPKFEATEPFPLSSRSSAIKDTQSQGQGSRMEEKPSYIYNGEENDYEDIDDVHDHILQGQGAAGCESQHKLNRTVSAPAGSQNKAETEEKSESEPKGPVPHIPIPPKGIVPGVIHGLGGKVRVPFIPPNFPDPPKDALIKPSEYLKSIQKPQNKGKYGTTTAAAPPTTPTGSKFAGFGFNLLGRTTPSPAVVESGSSDGGGNGMPPVPEETNNMEDELVESNSGRVNGNHTEGSSNGVQPRVNGHEGGGVRSEQLMKVTLRKTPMTRTNSAPPLGLGRVLPDVPSDQNTNSGQEKKPNEGNCGPSPLNVNMNIQNVQIATISRAAVIAELSESSQVGGVREWKDELRRRQSEQEKAAEKELAQIYSPLNFVAEVPVADGTGAPIPPWKRQMLAKKAAEKARKEAEEQRRIDTEAKRTAAIPPWRRQLLQRRESDGKYAQ